MCNGLLAVMSVILYIGLSIMTINTRYVIPDVQAQTRFYKTYLFMIYGRFRRYSHLPHQVANNGINCYDTKLSKKQNFGEHNYVNIDVTMDNRYI